jgi:hypothetical protein
MGEEFFLIACRQSDVIERSVVMDVDTLRGFFMWCTILNGALLIFSALICAFGGDWIYRMHGALFSMPRDAFNVVLYAFVGLYKILFLIFSLVPFVALVIIG